jgi:hypothetical protein
MPISDLESEPSPDSGVRSIDPRVECAVLIAYTRYPGRWSKGTLITSMRVPGIFDGLTPEDAADILDRIESVVPYSPRPRSES